MYEWYKQFTSEEYLNYGDLDELYTALQSLVDYITYIYGEALYQIITTTIQVNMILYADEVNLLIDNINNFKSYYFAPEGWVDLIKYKTKENIDNIEINDFYNNLKLSFENVGNITDYNIWNYNYLLNWNTNSSEEWEE